MGRRSSGSQPRPVITVLVDPAIPAPVDLGMELRQGAATEMKGLRRGAHRAAISGSAGRCCEAIRVPLEPRSTGTRSDLLPGHLVPADLGSRERATGAPDARAAAAREAHPSLHARGQCAPRHRDLAGHPAVSRTVVVDRPARSEGTIAS